MHGIKLPSAIEFDDHVYKEKFFLQNKVQIEFHTNPLGLAKRCLLGDGMIVPVDDAEDADEESSS